PGAGVAGRGAAGPVEPGVGRRAGAPGGDAGGGAVSSQAGSAGGTVALLRAPCGSTGLCRAAGAGPVDRPGAGGGGLQAGDRAADEADGGALAGTAGQPHGDPVLHLPRRYLGTLLATPTQLTTRIRARTPGCGARIVSGSFGSLAVCLVGTQPFEELP